MPTALLTGASRGLGRALAEGLADRGWTLVLDARRADGLTRVVDALAGRTVAHAVAGDVIDPAHRAALSDVVSGLGGLDLLVNNASALGPSPLEPLVRLDPRVLSRVLETNVVAPLALFRALHRHLTPDAVVVNVSSDAAVEAHEGWGGYGASKAALDHASAVLAVEHPTLHVYALDPGDMRTAMHQAAFPDEDISDRPLPATVVPALLRLVDARPPSGRLRAEDLLAEVRA